MPVYSKKLTETPPKRNKYIFLLLWLIGHMLAWASLYAVMGLSSVFPLINDYWVATLGLTLGTVTSLTQYLLIRWQFGHKLKWWLPLSIIAWLFAASIPFNAALDLGSSQFDVTIQAIALYAPAALVQAFLLRKHVRQAWLWLLASVAGTTTFALTVTALSWQEWSVFTGYGLYASTTALTLLWLFGMSSTQNQQLAESESYYRLTDAETASVEDEYYQEERESYYDRRR